MDSKLLYTEEIDDLDEAVEELIEQTEGFVFKKNTVAILYVEEEADYPALYAEIAKHWSFPIVGCTAMAMMLGADDYEGEGFRSGGITVLLLTADDCEFSVGITDTLTGENFREEIAKAYKPASDAVNHEEKMIIAYGVMVTEEVNIAGDDLVTTLDELSNHTPIIGGLASDNLTFSKNYVFLNDKVVKTGMSFILVSGNVHPIFLTVNSVENRANFSYEITKSHSNQVFKLGEYSLVEVLEREDFAVANDNVLGDYLLSPFIVSVKQPDGECVEAARNLSFLDRSTGSGNFLGAMPEGSLLEVGIINREDVQKSVEVALKDVVERLKNADGEYKTLYCTTCAARFLALASDIRAESQVCDALRPAGVNLLGYYAYGEFCPVLGKKSGEAYNMFHNFTFTVIAF